MKFFTKNVYINKLYKIRKKYSKSMNGWLATYSQISVQFSQTFFTDLFPC